MPTFNVAADGHYFTLQGYKLGEEAAVATYTVLPRADTVFRLARFRDGEEVPKELFYALVLEGSLTTPYLIEHPPTIWKVPEPIRDEADNYGAYPNANQLLHNLIHARHVLDFFRLLARDETGPPPRHELRTACYLFLLRRLREVRSLVPGAR